MTTRGLIVVLIIGLPALTFVALAAAERWLPTIEGRSDETPADRFANVSGIVMQGALVPGLAYVISTSLLPRWIPDAAGVLGLNFGGAFLLCFVGVDLLYFAQHVAFHRVPALWGLHRCHHASPSVSVWTTARNSWLTNLLFVYLLVNPWLAYISGSVDGYLLGASLTACLDLWRHTRLVPRGYWAVLERVLITPTLHHQHHDADRGGHNFGANLSLWDRACGTLRSDRAYPSVYAADAPDTLTQLVHPLSVGNARNLVARLKELRT